MCTPWAASDGAVDFRLPARLFVGPEFAFSVGESNAYVATMIGLGFRF
jgi:hypothetical protein